MINQIWFILQRETKSKNSGLTWCWTHVNLPFASMAAHAVRVSRNCFNLSSSRFHFFHLKASETQSFILKLHLSTYKLQLFRFPTFSRYIFFWLPDQGRLRISRYCGNHLQDESSIQHPIFHAKKLRGLTYRIIPIPARSCYQQLHQGMSWTTIIQLGACWKTEV